MKNPDLSAAYAPVVNFMNQLSRRQRVVIPFFYILPDTCLYQSQARNWIRALFYSKPYIRCTG
jgi:hypothetical protein